MLKTAKLITRYQIGTWTRPTEPGAFTKSTKPSCYHADGYHFYNKLPSCAVSDMTKQPNPSDIRESKS